MPDYIFVTGSILALFGIRLLLRSFELYRWLTLTIRRIHAKNTEDTERGLPFNNWRYRALNRVSYNRMVLMFWREPREFYRDSPLDVPLTWETEDKSLGST